MTAGLYVQYGCGATAPVEWLNFDASPRLRLERMPGVRGFVKFSGGLTFPPNVKYGNIVQGLPVADKSAAAVYCSHILEHLPRDHVPEALRNTFRILRPGGLFRLVVPDLRWRAERYLESAAREDSAGADRFLQDCLLGVRLPPTNMAGTVKSLLSKSAHCWMYDFAALRALHVSAGFADIRRCAIGDSGDPMFALVEDRGRFFEGTMPELAIEARRPRDPAAGSA